MKSWALVEWHCREWPMRNRWKFSGKFPNVWKWPFAFGEVPWICSNSLRNLWINTRLKASTFSPSNAEANEYANVQERGIVLSNPTKIVKPMTIQQQRLLRRSASLKSIDKTGRLKLSTGKNLVSDSYEHCLWKGQLASKVGIFF